MDLKATKTLMACAAAVIAAVSFFAPAAAQSARKIEILTPSGARVVVKRAGEALPRQVAPQQITLTLVDARARADKGALNDDGVIRPNTFNRGAKGEFTVRADVSNGGARSMRFYINDAPVGLDATQPFTLFGDAADPSGYARQPIPERAFILRAVAYAGPDGRGAILADKSIVVDVR